MRDKSGAPLRSKWWLQSEKKGSEILWSLSGREGTLDSRLHWYPKFYNHIILLVGSKTLDTFNDFSLFDLRLVVSNLLILFIISGNVYCQLSYP